MAWLNTQQATPVPTGKGGKLGAAATDSKGDAHQVLSMYAQPPEGEVVIEDFERFAISRLRVLKGIEDAKSRGKKPDELHSIIMELDRKHLRTGSRTDNWWRDQVSHFVLRLAHCRGEELRRWFLAHEGELFAARFREEPGKTAFLKKAGLPYQPLPQSRVDPAEAARDGAASSETAETLQARLAGTETKLRDVALSRGDREAAIAIMAGKMGFYEVPFEDVPDLVRMRRVLLVRGQAFVQQDQVGSLLVRHFRASVARGLALSARRWATHTAAAEAGRLAPVVESLATRYLGPDYGDAGAGADQDVVTAGQVPALARQSFPLCMALMTQHLHAEHHLRHGGRIQLGLFLKGIGLPLEEALAFWRAEFSAKTPAEKFNKEYAYNVRYNYGKEGSRKDYTPFSCLKIISTTPSVGDVHGCPYKTLDRNSLRTALQRLRVASPAVEEAVAKAKMQRLSLQPAPGPAQMSYDPRLSPLQRQRRCRAAAGHYQLACGAAFQGAHGCACDSGINHPNQYYDESRKVLAEQAAPSPGTPAVTAPGPPVGTPAAPSAVPQH